MNLHFNLFNHKGSKLVIYMTLTLSMFLFCFTAFGQTPLNIDGESLFRTHGYGVENHKFKVEVLNTDLEPANVNVDLEMDIIEAGEVDMKWNSGAKTLELYQMAKGKNEVSVYSVSGQLIFTKDIPYTQEGYDLNLDFLTPGYIYLVSLVNESGIHTQKIFVN